MSNNNQKNFYQGQNVLAKDLNDLQAYSDKNRNILVSDLLGSGILNGFEVTHKTDLTFSVSPGVAFDKNGNRLILEESTDVVLAKPVYIDGKSKPIKIRIKHSYIGSEPKKDSQDIETLTILTPSVKFITDETPEENLFQIATITLNEHADPLITRGEIFIALPDLTNTVSKNKVEIDKKVDDNTSAITTTNTAVATNKSAITTTNTEINKKVTDLTNTVATTNTTVAKNTSGVASNKTSINKLNSVLSNYNGDVHISSTNYDGTVSLSSTTVDIYATDSISLYTSGSSTSMSRGIVLSTDRDIHLNPDDNGGKVNINGSPIIETGKGSVAGRGTYTKFYDGTLINLALIKYDSGYNGKYIAEFPCAFIDTNYSIDSILLGMKDPSAISKTTSKVEVYEPILPPNWNYSNPSYLGLFVGRWK